MIAALGKLLLLLPMALMLLHASRASAAGALPEYTIKTGYLYNFAMLTKWPASSAGAHLELCHMGNGDFGATLASLQDKLVNNRRINVRRIDAPGETKDCHVLFVTDVELSHIPRIMSEVAGQPVLTVTDDENVARAGAAIYMRPEQQRLVFEINNSAARRVNLNISARLLRLARGGGNE